MRVRIKTWLPALAAFVAFVAMADTAAAQCGGGGGGCPPPPPPPPPCCQPPPPPCCQPPPPPPPPPQPPCCEQPPPPPCCGGGGNINVNVNVNANANANANAGASIRARGRGDVFIQGGGGAYFTVDQPYPTTIQGLNVEAAAVAQVVRVPYSEIRRSSRRVVIQAVCIDDRNIPHPASQVRPDRDVHDDYEGELYRCLAGARLQITIADYLDRISFDHGETMVCQKGESLWFGQRRGGQDGPGGGVIECRPQKSERDCNERSLLRRYGAGVKILTIWREETITAYREEVVQAAGLSISGASMTLDGGVGGRVF